MADSVNLVINPAARLSVQEIAARAEVAALLAAPSLADADLLRLPVLAACLGLAITVERCDWGGGVDGITRSRRVVGVPA